MGETEKELGGPNATNPFASLIDEAEGLDKIEDLQVRREGMRWGGRLPASYVLRLSSLRGGHMGSSSSAGCAWAEAGLRRMRQQHLCSACTLLTTFPRVHALHHLNREGGDPSLSTTV